jgi:hypothetical protein
VGLLAQRVLNDDVAHSDYGTTLADSTPADHNPLQQHHWRASRFSAGYVLGAREIHQWYRIPGNNNELNDAATAG